MKRYLQAARVETILGEIIDGHMIFKRDGTAWDYSPDCDKITFNERQCCNEILRRFAALEAERDEAVQVATDAMAVVSTLIRHDATTPKGKKAVLDFIRKYPTGATLTTEAHGHDE